jgi:hypothetical protein
MIDDGTQVLHLNPLLCDVNTTQSEINALCDFPSLILNGVGLNIITDNSVLLQSQLLYKTCNVQQNTLLS